ncbi:MAG: hypothetical protein ABI914_03530 [Acidobacteriota bacterium]
MDRRIRLRRAPLPPAESAGLPHDDNFDALLYLGPVRSIPRAPNAP